ncbi:sulfur carrier protein ThiS [Nocardioides zeae]|uniref:Sulfur carrier protein ThiS n=1 Tax=Nocardioides imazamoxiresistens TaxID=3231893 RepID=A0ABU3PZ72_9ACTN|nr:sulfur carrier protein ThiS [Nocardioides zeae]MDT9594449.1 sulfur carrier protein ThiS [Nocardioides zeae]
MPDLVLNGAPVTTAATTVAGLVEDFLDAFLDPRSGDLQGCAVAVDGIVVPRADHATTALRDGAVVEVVTAVQGG